MKAIQFDHYGEASVLQITEVPTPQPQKGQLFIQVKAFGINPIDWKLRSGAMQSFFPLHFPVTLGAEFAGIVHQVPDSHSEFKIGDRVYGRAQHSYAEYVLADANTVHIIPDFLDFNNAASLPSGSQVAYSALKTVGNLQADQHVLIHAGAGGVGVAAIQIAKAFGAIVTATASTSNHALLKQLGADYVIDYHSTDLAQHETLYDLILDSVGGPTQIKSWELLKPNGTLVSLVSDERTSFKHTHPQQNFYFMRGVQGNPSAVLHQLILERKIQPVIDEIFPIEQIAAAHQKSQSGHVSGKIVIQLGDDLS